MQGSVEGPHPLQPTFAKGLRRGTWLRSEAAADDGATWRTIDSQ